MWSGFWAVGGSIFRLFIDLGEDRLVNFLSDLYNAASSAVRPMRETASLDVQVTRIRSIALDLTSMSCFSRFYTSDA